MALQKRDFSELIDRVLPEDVPADLPEDPNESYRPSDTRFRAPSTIAVPMRSRTSIALPVWNVARKDEYDPADTQQHPTPGKTSFALRSLVGKGGFGEVWEAVQGSLGRLVAVKRLRKKHLKDSENRQRLTEEFQREALTTALLEHPNIVPVHDLGIDEEGMPLLAMKLIRGERWDELLHRDREVMPYEEFLDKHLSVFLDLCQAVAFAHSRGIIHRDIKPSQVMVGEFGEVLLTDWGIAVLFDASLVETPFQEMTGELVPSPATAFNPMGTPAYMAPEQTRKTAENIGPWTDIYLLGGVMYMILTGHQPHEAEDSRESFFMASRGEVIQPEIAAPGLRVPRELGRVCMKALDPLPDRRHTCVTEMIREVENYITGADRRREAHSLAGRVNEFLASPEGDGYNQLNECVNMLQRALNLSPHNSEALRLQNIVRERFARSALTSGDLTLAELMAGSVDEESIKQPLLAEIEASKRRMRGSARSKRILTVVTAILVLLIVFDAIFLVYWQLGERSESLRGRLEQTEQRAQDAEQRVKELERQLKTIAIPDAS